MSTLPIFIFKGNNYSRYSTRCLPLFGGLIGGNCVIVTVKAVSKGLTSVPRSFTVTKQRSGLLSTIS